MSNHNIQVQYVSAALASVGLLAAGYAFYRYQKNKLPKAWTCVGKLDNVYIYPVKSCAPVRVDSATCTHLGLKQGWLRDRVLMVVDEKNNFIHARVYPELLLVKPSVKNSILSLRHDDMDTLYINLAEVMEVEKPFNCTVWGCSVPMLDCGREAGEWFSKLLNRPDTKFKLVLYSSQRCRAVKDVGITRFYKFRATDTGALPDETAFNLLSGASLGELRARLPGARLGHRHFRPNFTVAGAAALDEDNWQYVKIGGNVFEVIKPCTRCVMTTIDPETGIRDPKMEPLEMLKSYRQLDDPVERKLAGSAPRMGLQLALRSAPGGTLKLLDDVFVSYK